MFPTNRQWVLTDSMGRVWRISVRGPDSGAFDDRDNRGAEVLLSRWAEEAFAPLGRGSPSLRASLEEMVRAIDAQVPSSRSGPASENGLEDTPLGHPLDRVRETFRRGLARGALRCEHAWIGGRELTPSDEDVPDTIRQSIPPE